MARAHRMALRRALAWTDPARGGIRHRIDDLAHSRCSGRARRPAHPRSSPRVGAASRSSSAAAATSMPGVQMPHCAAPRARKACCSDSPLRGSAASPSMVTMLRALRLCGGHQAGAGRLAVDQHGAGAAIARVAAALGARAGRDGGAAPRSAASQGAASQETGAPFSSKAMVTSEQLPPRGPAPRPRTASAASSR